LDPEDGGNMFFSNVCWLATDYTALYPRRYYPSVIAQFNFLSLQVNTQQTRKRKVESP
jgi:hypothetical protein